MRIGKYKFGIARGRWMWGREQDCVYGCRLWDFGPFYFEILDGPCAEPDDRSV
jgi:hypothetical protein